MHFESNIRKLANLAVQAEEDRNNIDPYDGAYDEFVDSLDAVAEFYYEAKEANLMILVHTRIHNRAIRKLDKYIRENESECAEKEEMGIYL